LIKTWAAELRIIRTLISAQIFNIGLKYPSHPASEAAS
jgi:hypothetical protein